MASNFGTESKLVLSSSGPRAPRHIGDQIFDKKFIFVPDSIVDENLISVPTLGLEGILHE